MKTKKKTVAVIDAQLMNVFKDIYSEAEARKAMRDASRAYKTFKNETLTNTWSYAK